MKKERIFIIVRGIVQGVGFRPFVYNLAGELNLKGWVNNNSEGVYIDLEGPSETLELFTKKLKEEAPPLSKIESIEVISKDLANFVSFEIRESVRDENSITLISPDMATCSDCRDDILSNDNRRYRYAFTNCTNCGPRFSIIKDIPYDRDKTTMFQFKMCHACYEEYTDPRNRRFHAQPNACSHCGPSLWIIDRNERKVHTEDEIAFTLTQLKNGKIFAIKGIGGFHLACDASNTDAVKLLRERKRRPSKPFAVMMKDLTAVKRYCQVSPEEEALLTGFRRPIVLLNRLKEYSLPDNIAPNQSTLGVMLPFTPLHELLFSGNIDVLIMTSANSYGLPLEYINDSALKNLNSIVDYYLMHNRDIHTSIDDSVMKVFESKDFMIRRARGYVPEPFMYECEDEILACGPNMKNTFSISKDKFIFMSQHNGDLENIETFQRYKSNIEHFKKIFKFSPKYVAVDMHPGYSSTEYGKSLNLPVIPIQHHHAHIVSCMTENGLSNHRVIGIAFDGTGYGNDGKVWGGEFLICDFKNFTRVAHLEYTPMLGGEASIKEPWKMACSFIYKATEKLKSNTECSADSIAQSLFGTESKHVLKMIEKNINCTETSSMGRLFDAVSAILGVCTKATYEGQASIELEQHLTRNICEAYPYSVSTASNPLSTSYEEHMNIDLSSAILGIISDINNQLGTGIISAKFHNTVVNMAINVCETLRVQTGISEVALSGGVFQNLYLLEKLKSNLEEKNFTVYLHSEYPTNDGSISLGQLVIANEVIKDNFAPNM